MPTPDITPPGQDQSAADADALQRASDQLGDASEAVAEARREVEESAESAGSSGQQTSEEEMQAADEALEAAEEALAEASDRLAEAAEQGGGDPEELNEAIAAAEEALAAAEEALAAAEAAATEESEALADAGGGGEEEPLPAEEENPSGGGGGGAASAAASQASAAASSASPSSSQSGGGASGAAANPAAGGDGGSGQPGLVVAVAGAQGSLEQGQTALDSAIRALIITGVYQPTGGEFPDGGQTLPAGGVIILMPGEPGENDKVAQLEGELEDSLIVIDGRLLDERNKLASQRTGGSPILPDGEDGVLDPGADAEALLEELGAGSDETMGAGEEADVLETGEVASADMEDLGAGKRSSNTARPDNIPEGVPDGSDDDIVARQIREAAMNETDPVLREKLWREYISYKKGGN